VPPIVGVRVHNIIEQCLSHVTRVTQVAIGIALLQTQSEFVGDAR
jgi:hypothetical protein